MTGRPKNTRSARRCTPAPAGVSALYSVKRRPPVVGDEERVEPRRGLGLGEAGVDGDQPLLPVGSRPNCARTARVAPSPPGAARANAAQSTAHAGLEAAILRRRHKARPQHGAQRPVAEEQSRGAAAASSSCACDSAASVVGQQRRGRRRRIAEVAITHPAVSRAGGASRRPGAGTSPPNRACHCISFACGRGSAPA